MKKYPLLTLLLTLCLLFTGCGANGKETASVSGGADSYYRAEAPEATAAGVVEDSEGGNADQTMPAQQKLIRTVWLDVETEDMDGMLSAVEAKTAALEGYIENRSFQNGSISAARRTRYGSLTIRIPAAQLDAFITNVSGISNIVSNRETTEDVTLSYVENESRITALETEQTRLLELLAKAESMDDILMIESRLTQIRGELERLKGQLRVYDNRVNYGTIHLNISEVREYTVEEPEPEGLWQRMGRGLSVGWTALTAGLGHLLVLLTTVLPVLLPLALVGFGIYFGIKRYRKKEKNTPPEREEKT